MRPIVLLAALAASVLSLPALAQEAPAPVPQAEPAATPTPAPAKPDKKAQAAAAAVPEVRLTPPAPTDPANQWLIDLSTGGRVVVWLRPDVAPKMVERVKLLTRQRFYDGLPFHRVIEGFMAQGGDPKGDGTGGSQLPDMPAEFNYLPHVRGAVAAARAEKEDSANSQFYIVLQPRLQLDRKYTVFGRVLSGMQYVDAIERGEPPANPTRIVHAYIASDNPPAFQPLPVAAAPSLTPAPTLAPTPARRPAPRRSAPRR